MGFVDRSDDLMDYRGIVAAIIAGTIGTGFIMIILALAWRDKQITDKGGEVMIALVSGMLMALGYYMGSQRNGGNKD